MISTARPAYRVNQRKAIGPIPGRKAQSLQLVDKANHLSLRIIDLCGNRKTPKCVDNRKGENRHTPADNHEIQDDRTRCLSDDFHAFQSEPV